jgi:CDP-glycerol glycerophosphotransferase (TagB/SpsB family)
VDDLDISPFLALADVLITDVSSTMFEFAALDKPVVLFDSPDWGKYENYNPEDIEFTWRDFALRTNTLEEMREAVKRSLEQPTEFSAIRTKYTQQLLANYKDGLAAERIVEAAHSLI